MEVLRNQVEEDKLLIGRGERDMKLRLLGDDDAYIIDRNMTIALNLVKKAVANGEDRKAYDLLCSIVEEIKPYIEKEYPS